MASIMLVQKSISPRIGAARRETPCCCSIGRRSRKFSKIEAAEWIKLLVSRQVYGGLQAPECCGRIVSFPLAETPLGSTRGRRVFISRKAFDRSILIHAVAPIHVAARRYCTAREQHNAGVALRGVILRRANGASR